MIATMRGVVVARRVGPLRCLYSQFRGAYNVESLHPQQSSSAIPKVPASPSDNPLQFNGYIPTEEIDKSFSTSSGPGGQHVNRVATRAIIRFNVRTAKWLSDDLKKRLTERYSHRINNEGDLIIASERTRKQHLNLADCFDKLRTAVYECSEELTKENRQPDPEKAEELRLRQEQANRMRLLEKRRHSMKKEGRAKDF
uniref:Large ribosomal subunit protein mL62 n=1 Tax=Plectus sambesii TaxID=2011161 RepID=A0A914W0J9_9BILA